MSVLILTDGSEKVVEMAGKIAKTLRGNILIREASAFAGTDLLPADVLFIGCCEPSPSSFGYIDELLHHINLAGRKCGVFSPSSKKALQYLRGILKSTGITIGSEPLTEANSADIAKWTSGVLSGN